MIHRSRPIILAAGAFSLLASTVSADILGQYTFGTGRTSILTPNTVGEGISAGTIIKDAGLNFDLNNPSFETVASAPFLRVTPAASYSNANLAVGGNASFSFTLSAVPGFQLDLTSLNFDAWKGGSSGTRGYALQTSADGFTSIVSTADLTSIRGTFTNYDVALSGASYQNLSSITFKMFSYSAGPSESIEYDNITVNGSATFDGFAWQGGNGKWDTSSANWSGPGTTYTTGRNVWFGNEASSGNVDVTSTGLNPSLMTFTNSTAIDYVFSGSSITAGRIFKSGNGTARFNSNVTSNDVTVDSGTIVVGAAGTLSSPNLTVSQTGTLDVVSGGKLGDSSGATVDGVLNLRNASQKLATLAGASTGAVNLEGTALEVTGTSTYAGKINGDGSLVKSTGGVLTLSGSSTYSGGTRIDGGTLQLNHASAAGTGRITVNPEGKLSLGAGITSQITLAGGTIGVSATLALPSTVTTTVSGSSTVNTFNPATGTTGNDLILNGPLTGTGDLHLVSINNTNPDSAAFRLRGPASDYSGTITVARSAKFEVQTSVASGSPMGTGKLVMTGGEMTNTAGGTFSIINVRNNFTGDTTFGNEVEVIGTGGAYFNMVGSTPNGSVTHFGNLTIGDNQTVAAVSTAATVQTLGFSSVTLTGGMATFAPRPAGNTSYTGTESIQLGKISETVTGSGIIMSGAATLTLAGENEYTGPTFVNSGTLAVEGSIASSELFLNTATLKGGGRVGKVEVFGGTVAPGNGIGKLTVDELTFTTGGLSIEIGGMAAGSYDQLAVEGGLAFNSPVTLSLDFTGYLPLEGDQFMIVNNTFAGEIAFGSPESRLHYGGVVLDEGTVFTATSGGFTQSFKISYEGGTGNDIVLSAVPEPATATALLLGAGILAVRRRRR